MFVCPFVVWGLAAPKNGPSDDVLEELEAACTTLPWWSRVPWVRTKGAARPKSVRWTVGGGGGGGVSRGGGENVRVCEKGGLRM